MLRDAPAPTAPSAATGSSRRRSGPDDSTLKVTPPAIVSPIDGVNVDSRKPTLVWANSNGNYGSVGLAYEIEIEIPDGTSVYPMIVGETPNTGSHKVSKELTHERRALVAHPRRPRRDARPLVDLGGLQDAGACRRRRPRLPGGPAPDAFRTPDPPAGQRLPLINRSGCRAGGRQRQPRRAAQLLPGPQGGSWLFMDLVVDALQTIDLRWGYNAKRGNMNDPSLDVAQLSLGRRSERGQLAGLHHRHHRRPLRLEPDASPGAT